MRSCFVSISLSSGLLFGFNGYFYVNREIEKNTIHKLVIKIRIYLFVRTDCNSYRASMIDR